MIEGQQFEFCCAAGELGNFEWEMIESFDEKTQDYRNVISRKATKDQLLESLRGHMQIATLAKEQLEEWQPLLEDNGFRKIGTFSGNSTLFVTLFARGLRLTKGGEKMTIKKTKKTIALKTGKKVVKKVGATR